MKWAPTRQRKMFGARIKIEWMNEWIFEWIYYILCLKSNDFCNDEACLSLFTISSCMLDRKIDHSPIILFIKKSMLQTFGSPHSNSGPIVHFSDQHRLQADTKWHTHSITTGVFQPPEFVLVKTFILIWETALNLRLTVF